MDSDRVDFSKISHLEEWWEAISKGDYRDFFAKNSEYGDADLNIMAEAMDAILPGQMGKEASLAFYLLGKVARLYGAYAKGIRPSDDTLHDITVYSMMMRALRFSLRLRVIADTVGFTPGDDTGNVIHSDKSRKNPRTNSSKTLSKPRRRRRHSANSDKVSAS